MVDVVMIIVGEHPMRIGYVRWALCDYVSLYYGKPIQEWTLMVDRMSLTAPLVFQGTT